MVAYSHRRWTPQEIAALEMRRNDNVIDLALFLGRSVHSVKARLERKVKTDRARRYRAISFTPTESQVDPRPPEYILRERQIRWQIMHENCTAQLCGDPKPGYTAMDTKKRKLSVQDAIEIRSLYTGAFGEKSILARGYRISDRTFEEIVSGQWFERLNPRYRKFDPGL